MSNQHGPRFAKETLQGQQHQIHLVRKLHHYQRKCHVQRRQMTLAIIITKTVKSISQPKIDLQMSPYSVIHFEIYYGIAAQSQKRKTSIQVIFTQSSVSMTTTSEYLPVSGSNLPSLHLSQSLRLRSRFHQNKLQQSEQHKSFLTCL